jgi:ketosteroid isomerase-like protein
VKALFSDREDVTLANPLGPAVRGWCAVSEALDFASSRFRQGDVEEFQILASYANDDLLTMLAPERWQAKVGDRSEVENFELRVTSTLRREDGAWRLVHRHADPIVTPHPDGPLRAR